MADNTESTESAESAASVEKTGSPEPAAAVKTGPLRGHRQVKVGRVVSDKMDKTVVVAVANTVVHRLYHRTMKRTAKFHAHDEENQCRTGDVVEIVASRPLSKTKRWRVRQIVERAQ